MPLWRILIITIMLVSVSLAGTPAQAQSEPPLTNAQNLIVLSDFNEVLYERNSRERIPLASLTKLMTAIVAVRYSSLDTPTIVDQNDLIGEASMGLILGDELTVGDLLYGLLIPSGNDAALAIARTVGWQAGDTHPDQAVKRFVQMMNTTAREIGLRDTHFMNPHGLDEPNHYSTAYDVAIMLRASLNYPEIRQRMTTPAIRVGSYYDLYSNNPLLRDRTDYLGGKTGLTDGAGFCLATAARRDGRMVIAVVMRDDWNWWTDVDALLDYGLDLAHERGVPFYATPDLIGSQLDQPRPTHLVARPSDEPFIGPLPPNHPTAQR
jgi:serine-type D-Ala-D-Ala carboxypeptidase (penicillin-binding protein 5/6)